MAFQEAFRLTRLNIGKELAEKKRKTAEQLDAGEIDEAILGHQEEVVLVDNLHRLHREERSLMRVLEDMGGDLPLERRDELLRQERSMTDSPQIATTNDLPVGPIPPIENTSEPPKRGYSPRRQEETSKQPSEVKERKNYVRDLAPRQIHILHAAFAFNEERTDYAYPTKNQLGVASYSDMSPEMRATNASRNFPKALNSLEEKILQLSKIAPEDWPTGFKQEITRIQEQPEYQTLSLDELAAVLTRKITFYELQARLHEVPTFPDAPTIEELGPTQLIDRDIATFAHLLQISDKQVLKDAGITLNQDDEALITKIRERYAQDPQLSQLSKEAIRMLRNKLKKFQENEQEVLAEQNENPEALHLLVMLAQTQESEQLDALFAQPEIARYLQE